MYNKGLTLLKGENLKNIIASSVKNGWAYIYMTSPKNERTRVRLELMKKRGKKVNILIDTYTSNWDITEKGEEIFKKIFDEPQFSQGILNKTCGTRVMELICEDDKEFYEIWVHLMLLVLSKPGNIRDTMEDLDYSLHTLVRSKILKNA